MNMLQKSRLRIHVPTTHYKWQDLCTVGENTPPAQSEAEQDRTQHLRLWWITGKDMIHQNRHTECPSPCPKFFIRTFDDQSLSQEIFLPRNVRSAVYSAVNLQSHPLKICSPIWGASGSTARRFHSSTISCYKLRATIFSSCTTNGANLAALELKCCLCFAEVPHVSAQIEPNFGVPAL